MNHVDPPDLSLWPTLRHLFPLWWGQRRFVAIGLSCSLVFTGLSLLIPILIQRTIDNAIVGSDHSLLVPYLALILAIATVRFFVNFVRRWLTSKIGIAVEAQLRGKLYGRISPTRARSTTATRRARSSRAPPTTSIPSATSSAGASCRHCRA